MYDPEAYKKDPKWQKLDKSARRWRKALIWLTIFWITIYVLMSILGIVMQVTV